MSQDDSDGQECIACPQCGRLFVEVKERDFHIHNAHKPLRDEEYMRELYNRRGQTTEDIAEAHGYHKTTVSKWLKRHDIEVNSGGKDSIEDLDDGEYLREQYVDRGLSTTEIAEKHDCSDVTVGRWLKKHDIETRQFGKKAPEELQDKETLKRLYVDEGLFGSEIADRVGCGESTVHAWLHHHDIDVRDKGLAGQNNPMWKEETAGPIHYGRGWHEQKRETIRERDDRRCQGCGEPEENLPVRLNVHHIRPARSFTDPEKRNDGSNLISLCPFCHGKAEKMAPLLPDFIE